MRLPLQRLGHIRHVRVLQTATTTTMTTSATTCCTHVNLFRIAHIEFAISRTRMEKRRRKNGEKLQNANRKKQLRASYGGEIDFGTKRSSLIRSVRRFPLHRKDSARIVLVAGSEPEDTKCIHRRNADRGSIGYVGI